MKDKFDKLRDKTNRIVEEGERLLKRKKVPSDWCHPKCAACLAAEARGNVDKKDFDIGFDSSEDICMLEARDILGKKYKLETGSYFK